MLTGTPFKLAERYAGAPTFSPDGAWIAFVTRDGKVKKVYRTVDVGTHAAEIAADVQ